MSTTRTTPVPKDPETGLPVVKPNQHWLVEKDVAGRFWNSSGPYVLLMESRETKTRQRVKPHWWSRWSFIDATEETAVCIHTESIKLRKGSTVPTKADVLRAANKIARRVIEAEAERAAWAELEGTYPPKSLA